MKREEQKLIDVAYKIIKSENLPVPTDIKYRRQISGTRKQLGSCIRKKFMLGIKEDDRIYKIIIHTIKAKYYPDKNGRFILNGERVSRYTKGEELSFSEIIDTMAHEIAHLKIWTHIPEHKIYTNKIKELLINKLKEEIVEI